MTTLFIDDDDPDMIALVKAGKENDLVAYSRILPRVKAKSDANVALARKKAAELGIPVTFINAEEGVEVTPEEGE